MSPSKSDPTRVKIAIPMLLGRQVTVYGAKTATNVSLMPLSMLILESAQRYLADAKAFGKGSNTLDAALAPIFTKMFVTDGHRSAFNAGFAVYEKLADQISTTVAGQKLRAYCATKPSQISLPSVLEEVSPTTGLHSIAWEAGTYDMRPKKYKRRAIASLDGIECKNPEEQQTWKTRSWCVDTLWGKKCTTITNPLFDLIGSGDEIYYATFGAVYSQKGYLERTSQISPVTEHVGTVTGHVKKLNIPGNMKYPVYCDLDQETISPAGLPPYNVTYSFTLFEREWSDKEKRQAIAQAAMDATEAVTSLLSLDWISFGVNIAQLLYDLAVALDDDDLLGSRAFHFGDIGMMELGTRDTTVTFTDTHLLNKYRYVVSSHFTLESLPEG